MYNSVENILSRGLLGMACGVNCCLVVCIDCDFADYTINVLVLDYQA